MTTRTIIGLAAIALSAISFGSAAMAQETESVSKTVVYKDLDLSTAEGKKQFETRVKAAVLEACSQANPKAQNNLVQLQECRYAATKQAMRDLKVAIANYNDNRIASR
jgi:UrcA family protein